MKSIRWQNFLGLLNYFKHTQKKDRLDTNTLLDPDGPLSRDISSSSIRITNPHVCQVSATGRIKWKEILRAIYFINTSTKVFYWKKSSKKCCNYCTMLCYYSKTFLGMAWLSTTKFYSLGIVSSYLFRHTAGLLIRQYYFLPAYGTRLVHSPMF